MSQMDESAVKAMVKDNTPRPLPQDRRIPSQTLLGTEGRVVMNIRDSFTCCARRRQVS